MSTAGGDIKWHIRSESDLARLSGNLKAYKCNNSTSEILVYIFCDKYLLIIIRRDKEHAGRKEVGEERRKEERRMKEKEVIFHLLI